jgi:hypothetical protein
MNPHHSARPLVTTFLQALGREEQLLRDAHANVTELHAALCRGDLSGARATCSGQQQLATALHDAAAARAVTATNLARELGLPGEGLTLSALAAKLPAELAADVLAARTRLSALTSELVAIQARNANLISHLRSFFRGVLSGLPAADAPPRYGPTGRRLEPNTWIPIPTCG